jgi:hypothetical protein
MDKLRTFVATGLVAATVAAGGLASAPSASTLPDRTACDGMARKGKLAYDLGTIWYGVGDFVRAARYYGQSEAYYDAAADCVRSQR